MSTVKSTESNAVYAQEDTHVAILATRLELGGVDRMTIHIARGLGELGYAVDLLLGMHSSRTYTRTLPASVRIRELNADNHKDLIAEVGDYLQRVRPAVMLSAKGHDDRIAIEARDRARSNTRIVLRTGTNISGRLEHRQSNRLRRWMKLQSTRRLYQRADRIICVSQGVLEDVRQVTGLPPERLIHLRNPTITPETHELASKPVDHPWLGNRSDHDPPVILGAGALRRQKNFEFLMRAFALVRSQREARLIILGEGRRRNSLARMARDLGIDDDVSLPGFSEDVLAYMAHADVFVLSSYWEGTANVLIEALAVATPAVATDCPSGPREILQDGRLGELVPIDDDQAMASAIERTLDHPVPARLLQDGVADYTLEKSAIAYAHALGLVQM